MFNNDPFINYKFECNPDCQDRKVGCRSGCERYARDTALRESIKSARREKENYEHYAIRAANDRKARSLRRKNKIKTVGIHFK